MTTALKLRRGTTSQHSTFTGADGEVTVDTTKKTVVVHDGATAGGAPLMKETGTADTKFRIDSSGNVGLGTSSPGAQLEVYNASTARLRINSGSNLADFAQAGTSLFVSNNANGPMILQTNNTERMRIEAAGNVGIGTPSPAGKLTVVSGTNNGIRLTDGVVDGVVYMSSGPIMTVGTVSNHGIQFYTNNSSKATIDTNGTLILAQGQIKFPATQSASSDANTLDDYEEGTWTPSYTGSASNPTVSYGGQTGRYVKVGKVVHFWCYIYVTTTSGGSGDLQVAGLPFAVSEVQGGALNDWSYGGWNTQAPQFLHMPTGGTVGILNYISGASTIKIPVGNLKNGCELTLSGSYQTS